MATGYALKPMTHEQSVDWLRRRLGKPTPVARSRRVDRLHVLGTVPRDELIEGLEVLVLFVERGRCPKVGRVMAVRKNSLGVMWWGGDATEHLLHTDVQAIRLIGEHSWDVFHAVSAAQRRFECPPQIFGGDRRYRP